MSQDCSDLLPLLAARSVGLLADDEAPVLEAHLASCTSCPEVARKLEQALEKSKPVPAKAPEGVWEKIARGIEDERAGRRVEPAPSFRILMSCTFCHSVLDRKEAAFCASCLAPHHADCFEIHGRCSAPGCSEWRTVQPRGSETRPRNRVRRYLAPALALVLGGAAAAAAAAFATRPTRVASVDAPPPPQPPIPQPAATQVPKAVETPTATPRTVSRPGPLPPLESLAAVLGEPDQDPPPYPWLERDSTELGKKLLAMKVSLNFPGTPLSEVCAFLSDILGVKITLDPSVDPVQIKISLRLQDVVAWNALAIILDQTNLAFVIEKDGLRIGSRDALPEETRHPRVYPSDLVVEGPRSDPARERAELERTKISANFETTPISECIDFFRDILGRNVIVTQAAQDVIDANQLKVTLRLKDISAANALDLLFGTSEELTWTTRNGNILVTTKGSESQENRAVLDKKVSLALRGATARELMAELKRQGVQAMMGTDTWASHGTFSLVVKDMAVEELVKTIRARTALNAWVNSRHGILVLEGVVPSVREALAVKAPEHFAGVTAEIADLRDRLALELQARAEARADANHDPLELNRRERAVDLSASAILGLVSRVRTLETAEQRLKKARKDEAATRVLLQRAQESVDASKFALARLEEAPDTAGGTKRKTVEEAKTKLEQAEADRERQNARLGQVIGEIAMNQADMEALKRLDRGARLADAERRSVVAPVVEEPAWVKEYRRKLASQKVTFNFESTPLNEVVAFLQDLTGLNFTVSKEIEQEQIKVTLRLKDVTLQSAIDQILEPSNLDLDFVNESIRIKPKDEPRRD